jgi:hypothetical protein
MPTVISGRRAGALACIVASAAGLAACAASAPAQPSSPPVDAVWQRHQATISYFGLTALYSCDGLEDKVRTLLLYLGARRDLKVQDIGCDRPFNAPGHLTTVRAEFYTLAPAAGEAAGAIAAQWDPITIRPMVPVWMGMGECELLEQIKPIVTADFSSRDLDYHTACIPHDATISDYALSSEFLKPVGAR